MKISVAILAGGMSTRMGTNKALLEFNNSTFLGTLVKEMESLGEVLVCVDEKSKYSDMGYNLVEDEHKGIGPMEGIYQALMHADEEYVFVCATDMPFLKAELVEYMMEFVSGDYDCYVLKDENRVHPLCAIYSKRMIPAILSLINGNNHRLVSIFNLVRTKYIDIEKSSYDKKNVKNINTKEEYESLSKPVVFAVSGIKDSGKTGLIIKLINEFINDGKSVGIIKHDGHDFEIDIEGTDTYRCMRAGACATAIYSEKKYALVKHSTPEITALLKHMDDLDVVIMEGFKYSDYPKVEVVRKEISDSIVCNPDTLICVATNAKLTDAPECQVLDIDDIEGIYSCIKKYFAKMG